MALNIQNGGVFYSLRMLTEWQPFYRQYQQLFVVKSYLVAAFDGQPN